MSPARLALLLPGQGSQHVGMARELAAARPEVAAAWALADEVLETPLSRICWEGPDEELVRTENAQPALLLHSWSVWISLPEGLRRRAVIAAGHSLGEFSAWLLAGSLDLETALRLVRRRGELMAEAGRRRPGTMAAVLGLDPGEVEAACREAGGTVVPANYNAPGQIVISGEEGAVERAASHCLERGARRAIPLNVSGAFHSPLMREARDGLAEALREAPLRAPAFPVVANAAARAVEDPEEARMLLVEQVTSPVRWVESVAAMRERAPDLWLELGAGRVLTGLLKRIDRELPGEAAGTPEEIEVLSRKDGDA